MKISDKIVLHFNTPADATIFFKSFIHEHQSLPNKRSSSKMIRSDESSYGTFQIEAEDATAFRATINSIVQLAHVVDQTITIIQNTT